MESNIMFHENEITETKALELIKAGEKISSFTPITKLMELAAVTYQADAWKEISERYWFKRLARLAIAKDYKAIEIIPDIFKSVCVKGFGEWGNKVTRENIEEWKYLLNKQSPEFLKKLIRFYPGYIRYFNNENRKKSYEESAKAISEQDSKRKEKEDPFFIENDYECDLEENALKITPLSFLSLPTEEQTYEVLEELLHSQELFPPDFIKKLSIPNRNVSFYKRANNKEAIKYWESKLIPYLNKEVCEKIAAMHPEASIKTSGYLKKEYVQTFWNKRKETLPQNVLTRYFLSFPQELLTEEMLNDIKITKEILEHATFLCKTEIAEKYITRNPADILNLPNCYQTTEKLLRDGVPLSAKTIKHIKDENRRNKIALALNL